ncbi:MAG TPA: cytochrome C oxidase subunit IV family protein [Thermoanaerobaculia bacterium]
MTEHKHPNYIAIWWILLAVTVMEIGYSFLKIPRPILILGLVVMAVFKAVLVALYFMHLKFERKSLGIIVGSTLILAVILVSVGISEHVLPRP